MIDNQLIGRRGEDFATHYLLSAGYQILERNFRATRYGEIDIIAQKGDILYFVEVKTRVGNEFGRPEEAITRGKLHELRKMVDYYFNLHPEVKLSPQIDAIAITLNSDDTIQNIEHFENVTL